MKRIIILLALSLIYSSTTQMWKSEVASSPGAPVFYFKFFSTNDTEGTYQLFKMYSKSIDKGIKLEESGIWIIIDGEVCLINEKTNSGSCGKVTLDEEYDKLIWKDRETYTFNRYSQLLGFNSSELAKEAMTQIKNIVQASEIYKMETDSYPPDCWETLEYEGYLEIKKSITQKWEFECSFDEDGEGGTITATSTEEMGGGAGKIIRYDKETGKYSGYGSGNKK
tara:strand:+ start:62 stop:733 length:672 start_codon:yes stop_codon:yes gene_type:complete